MSNHQIAFKDSVSFFTNSGSFEYWYQRQQGSAHVLYGFVQSLEDSNKILIYHKGVSTDFSDNFNVINQANTFDTIELNAGDFYATKLWGVGGGGFHNKHYAKSLNNKKFKVHSFTYQNQITLTIDRNDIFAQPTLNAGDVGYAWEDQKPITSKDTLFYWPHLEGYQGTNISLMAYEENTQVFINDSMHILNTFERMDTSVTGNLLIRSNKPIVGFGSSWPTYLDGRPLTNSVRGAFTVTLSSADELIQKALVPTLTNDTTIKNIFGLITRSKDTTVLTINGSPPSGNFQPFAKDSNWSYINAEVSNGMHRIESSAGFIGYYYTYREYDSTLTQAEQPGNFGHVIPQYRTVPTDSFQLFIGTQENQLKPLSSVGNGDLVVCPGDSIYFSNGAFRNIYWTFQANNSPLNSIRLGEDLWVITFSTIGTYTFKIVDSSGCYETDSIIIQVVGSDIPNINHSIEENCKQAILNLSINPNANSSYQWLLPGGKTSVGASAKYELSGDEDSARVQLIQAQENCIDTLIKIISLDSLQNEPYELFPNVLTPNGDGVNDRFCFSRYKNHEDCFQIQVFNRNGALLYQSDNTNECWSPKNISPGVYYYILDVSGKTFHQFFHVLP
jgi:gliding motility-associated-like protein